MKYGYVAGVIILTALAGCSGDRNTSPSFRYNDDAQPLAIQQLSVSGAITVVPGVVLPDHATLTVILSDASLSGVPAKVISRQVVFTGGKQSPFYFMLPYNPIDISPSAPILLSAAITINGKVAFITDTVQPVINNGKQTADLHLVPVKRIVHNAFSQPVSKNPVRSTASSHWIEQ